MGLFALQDSVENSSRRAFAKLFNDHADSLYGFIFWRIGDEDQAKDLLSDAFTKAWEKWDAFTGEYPKAWLYTIAKNLIVDSYRKKTPEQLDETNEPVQDDDNAERVDGQMEREKLHRILALLDNRDREIVDMRIMQKLSAKECAAILDTSEENIRILQFRALKKLRKLYEAQ